MDDYLLDDPLGLGGKNVTVLSDGVKCFYKVTDGDKPVRKVEMDNPLANDLEVSSEEQSWLELTANVQSDAEKSIKNNNITLTITDNDLRDYLRDFLGTYIEHFSREEWEKPSVLLSQNFNPLLFHWRELKQRHDNWPEDQDQKTYKRLGIVMKCIREYYTSMVNIQETWDTCRHVPFKDLRMLFRPGSLIVANDWTQEIANDTPRAPQVLKVNHLTLEKDWFQFTAWLWDWDGSQLARTMYKFRIDRYEGSQVITRLPFYPLDFFEYDGKRGRDAIRSSPRYLCQKGQKPLSRKELFKQFTCDIDLRHRVPLEHKGGRTSALRQ